jgi:pentatricopeptide repeat protein
VFDQLLRRRVSFNAYTYNCLLQLCASAGRMDDALAVYNLQRLETEPANLPDSYTYNALMRGVLVSGSVELTQQVGAANTAA